MLTYAIIPMRDLLRDEPTDETHFEFCPDLDAAEVFAVVDNHGNICFDGSTHEEADAWILKYGNQDRRNPR